VSRSFFIPYRSGRTRLTWPHQRSIRVGDASSTSWTVSPHETGDLLAPSLVGWVIFSYALCGWTDGWHGIGLASSFGGVVAWQHLVGDVNWNVCAPYIAGLVS
jgi:hypothetical protein